MKLTVNRAALQDALILANSVVPSRTPKPVLGCVLLRVNGKLSVSATDLDRRIRCEVDLVDVQQPGEIAVSAEKLTAIVRASDADTMNLELVGDTLHVRTADSHYKLNTESANGFPVDRVAEDGADTLIVPFGVLANLLRRTEFCAARESTRYAFNAVLLEANDTTLRCVATDGRRLALASWNIEKVYKPISALIAAPAVKTLLSTDVDSGSPVTISLSGGCAMFAVEHIRLTTALVEGTFPPYDDVIPKDCDKFATLGREVIEGALKRAQLMTTEDSTGVRFEFTSSGVVLSSRSPSEGEATVTVACPYKGADIEIGLNPQFLLDAVKVMETDDVTLGMTAPSRPALLKSGDDFKVVVMPVNLN